MSIIGTVTISQWRFTIKTIDTLVQDIEEVLLNGLPDHITDDDIDRFGIQLARTIAAKLKREEREATLRMSNIGKPARQLWYEINCPQEGEPLPPEAYMKFLFGDILEDVLLFLAEAAGHRVEGRQDEQEIAGVKGHRDAVIDGTIVDAKSASSFAFKKFKEGRLEEDDPFGYVDQLQSYIHSGQDDPIVTDKDRGAFLVVDKTLGHICLDIHPKENFDIEAAYEYKKRLVNEEEPPARCFEPVPEGKSGNEKLGMQCGYCRFKHKCHPDLRTFLYSNGPVFLTKVVKEPRVPEIIDGEIVEK